MALESLQFQISATILPEGLRQAEDSAPLSNEERKQVPTSAGDVGCRKPFQHQIHMQPSLQWPLFLSHTDRRKSVNEGKQCPLYILSSANE